MMRRNFLAMLMAAVTTFLNGSRQNARAASNDGNISPVDAASAMQQRMRAALPYRYVTVAGEEALTEWTRLRNSGEGWPVVIGDDEALDRIAEQFSLEDSAVFAQPANASVSSPPTPAEIIAASSVVKTPEIFEQLWRDGYGSDPEDDGMPDEGAWPSSTADVQPGFTIASDILTGRPLTHVHILIIPTLNSYEVPAYLRWGNWNACPSPEIHVAAMRYWHDRYGAELIGINGDTINMRVARRPKTREEALNLARHQFFYCADIVYQGTDTLAPLAAGLMESDWWFFWWD
ncbi:DUF4253 domain-containing protein [Sphingobium sp. YR768]|uniref:DUF4253 domain-containing protein n=1 Tax=Sphingobium sp. YR768 TaxID=1884365 RepID=UPI0015A5CAA7|nr:DUF4253 domain-containing protein [Sphingobium sp. YR768]